RSLFESVYNRHILKRNKVGPSSRCPLDSLLLGFECRAPDEHKVFGTAGDPVPAFACPFSREAGSHHLLAVPSEDGVVQIYDTEKPHKGSRVLKAWLAHSNAVFDCAWMPGESKLVTASGDQMAKLWDVCAGEALGSFKGHQCSLKSVAFSQSEKAVFCTGGRDGNIMVWDIRCSKRDGFYSAVKRIGSAHNAPAKISVTPKRRNTPRGMAPSVDSQQSVTAVIFQDEKTLVSSGAVDGVIKVWDMRKNYTSYRMGPVPAQSFPYPGSSSRKRGFSSLVLNASSSLLFANCTEDWVYMFDVAGARTSP
uniref:Denticleless E3 ubiquitin protein ligase homolog (Drosophila) n=1 Tax=Petromyzon marinus TaxID=7757 RepID=S4RC75_PETMA